MKSGVHTSNQTEANNPPLRWNKAGGQKRSGVRAPGRLTDEDGLFGGEQKRTEKDDCCRWVLAAVCAVKRFHVREAKKKKKKEQKDTCVVVCTRKAENLSRPVDLRCSGGKAKKKRDISSASFFAVITFSSMADGVTTGSGRAGNQSSLLLVIADDDDLRRGTTFLSQEDGEDPLLLA